MSIIGYEVRVINIVVKYRLLYKYQYLPFVRLVNKKNMKLSAKEKELIKSRRKFVQIIGNSKKILSYRKASKESKGEKKISDFLKEERIEFKREWFFRGLYNNSTKQLLYFDFYLPEYRVCIEYDGEQHYSKDKTDNQKVNDFLKNAYCLKNKIPFLRIKYDDYDNIENILCEFFDKVSPL